MDDKLYTKEDFEYAMKLIGQTAYFLLKTHLPQQPDATHWAYIPLIGVMMGQTEIIGVHAEIEKKADKNGMKEMYRKLQFILRNPYYEKQEEPDDRSGPGWPRMDLHSVKEWNFAFMTLNQWFFMTREAALQSIGSLNNMYFEVK
jgi:hypothetical protein